MENLTLASMLGSAVLIALIASLIRIASSLLHGVLAEAELEMIFWRV